MTTNIARRFEGRLFVDSGRLCLVVEADQASGNGRISYSEDGKQQISEMPLAEIAKRIATNVQLDGTTGEAAARRVLRKDDGWYCSTREGLKGPYASAEEAERNLADHIVASQSFEREQAPRARRA